MKKKLIVSFSLLLGTFFLQAQTKTIPYQELKSASGASTGSGMFFGASMTADSITITFAGPSTRWIGLGFGTSMSGSDALIYTSSGSTQDWCDYFMGSYSSVVKDAKQDWNIKSNNVSGSTRTLVASRKLNTGDLKEDVVFNYNAVSINLIWARGSGSSFNLADHGGSNRAYGIALGWVSPDVTPPTISSLSPIDNAIGVSTSQSLKATFNENITLGTGTISLFTANDVIAETFTLPISNVSVNGATVSIKPTNLLKDSTAYYVIISNTAIKDVAGNFFTGITASSDWNFKTLTPQISADIVEISDKQYIKFTNSSIFIATNESDYDFQITDLQGNIIKEKNKVQGELTINISEFEPALYILTYRTNGNFLQRKFVVQ